MLFLKILASFSINKIRDIWLRKKCKGISKELQDYFLKKDFGRKRVRRAG